MMILRILICLAFTWISLPASVAGSSAKQFAVLDEYCDIYYPNSAYPKLTTPQWVGEDGVDAVVVFAIDDMRDHKPYETYLRPILERLKQIDGRAPVSIMGNNINPDEPHLQKWLQEGVSLETHTIDHPCPILDKGNFAAAKSTYDRCVDHFRAIPNNKPVAFRTPCMDGINSASPRLFAEILMRTTEKGNYLTLSSSIGVLLTPQDPENPRESVTGADGKSRFTKYLLPGYINYIEDYPYPYLIGNMFWETPFAIPDDYEGSRPNGDASPATVADMKASIDAVVAKKGIWVMTFHPYKWIQNTQVIELIDHCQTQYGRKVKFLSLREVQERIDQHLLAGNSVRASNGGENGVRLLDLNHDNYLDVVIGNEKRKQTRIWNPGDRRWTSSDFPVAITKGVRFGVMENNIPICFVGDETGRGLWRFENAAWKRIENGVAGLEVDGEKVVASRNGLDQGVRFRDLNGDDVSELIVSNPKQKAVFQWSRVERHWKKLNFLIPDVASLVTDDGRDNGVRFVDFNNDGADDLIFSNEKAFGLWLSVPKVFLGFREGWSREILHGKRGDAPQIPMISRGGDFPNNGAWFGRDHMWVQNEDTTKLPDLVERVAFADLLKGLQPPPKTAQEALQTITVAPEFKVELAAHEPAVCDPVYIDWGTDGTMWVVEMGDYPNGVDGKPGGEIRRLQDKDGDGFYEESTVFASHLNFPNGLMPWRNGVLVSAAPDILFLADTDGDGRADTKEVLFTGFVEGNQQHRFNGFELGLDNWIYGANGDSGGQIVSHKTGSRTEIRGRDFRFNPDTGEFQAVEGQTQFGRKRDDWGNWFGGANYTWGWHYFPPERYSVRNPSLPVERSSRNYNRQADGTRVFPLSRLQQRFNDIGMAGHVTSACSFTPYRDELFDGDFQNSIFICEPTHNLVHREVLEPDGVSFRSKRSASEEQREFMTSTDPWFRPVTMKTGPDGAIYVVDMYRLVIEHPEWIPEDIKSRIDVRSGSDKGRIYRVRPAESSLRKLPALHTLEGPDLARALESSSGWQRDTVQRLLLEKRPRGATEPLTALAKSATNPKVRLQALCALDATDQLSVGILATALADDHAAVRENAIRLTERHLTSGHVPPDLEKTLLARVNDPSLRVRYQLAFSLGYWHSPKAAKALADLAVRHSGIASSTADNDLITAILSSSSRSPALILEELLREHDIVPLLPVVQHLVQLLAIRNDSNALANLIPKLAPGKDDLPPAWQLSLVATILEATEKQNLAHAQPPAAFRDTFPSARRLVANVETSEEQRLASIRLLGREKPAITNDVEQLVALLSPQSSLRLQRAALTRLAQIEDPFVPVAVLARWKSAGSQAYALLSVLLRREIWTLQLLDTLADGSLSIDDLGATLRQELLAHRVGKIKERAEKLLVGHRSNRDQLIQTTIEKVSPLSGDVERGRALFETHCAACHRVGPAGRGNGPNLAMLYDQSVPQMVLAILDPNRAVEEKYRSYNATLKSGEEISGILLSESGNSITLMTVSGAEQTVLRQDIESLTASSRSMMPEGFEQFLQPQDLAGLIAFIRSSTAPARQFAGNKPQAVTPDAQGIVRLGAATAEIYGDTLVFEERHANLGYWSSQNDRAIWTVDLPSATTLDLWLDFACPNQTAGNKFVVRAADKEVIGTIPTTGSWDNYQQRKFGTLKLPAGRSRVVVGSASAIRGNLMDLRELRLVPPALGETAFAKPK